MMKDKKILLAGCCCLFTLAAPAQEKRVFSLDECKAMAVEYNVQVKNGQLDVETARQTRKEAFTKYFPSISASGTTYKADDNLIKATLPPIPPLGMETPMEVGVLEQGSMVTVSAMQPVFSGGQIVNSNKLAKVAFEASELQYDMTKDQVTLETEEHYWKIVSLKETVKTLDVLDSLLSSLYKDVNLAVETGITTRNDLLTVRLKQNELNSTRLEVENGLALSRMALCQFIGLPLDSANYIDVPDFTASILAPENYRVDHQAALYGLSGYRLLDKNVEVHQLKRKIKFGEQLPSVGVGVSYAHEDLMDRNRNHVVMMATVSIPITDWWSGHHKVRRSRMEERKAVNQREDGAEQLQLKMQQSWHSLTEAHKQIALAESAIEESSENVRMQTANYQAGTSTLSELLDAQSLFRQSRNRYTDACITYQTRLTQYLIDTGQ
ncbi:TolC family protein [Phocaeicola sartorii]|uniref:TolC family protein n=1 Tax=Phocaeicola sartorii TaxID=671267 RepID=UPI0024326B39|nr:TolC family protein [Phocaeicola sartorii]